MNIKAILKALFAVTVWGASFVATKIALQYVVPTTLVWMRFAMGVAILGLAVGLSKQFSLPKGKDWGYFALLGFLGITFHQWLQSTALVTARASTTSWIVASSPMFMAILGVIFLKEYLVWHQIAGIILAAFGVFVRDVAQITGMFTTVLLFVSPVFYPISALPPKYQGWLLLNPLAFIIEEGRKVLVLGQLPNIERWVIMTAVGLLIAWAAFAWFQKTRKGFADVL